MKPPFALLLSLALLLPLVGVALAAPLTAQDAPGFVTNTPPAPPPVALPALATNTPRPLPADLGPAAPYERYALRRWDESALVVTLIQQAALLQANETDRALAIRLLQHELAQRFPGAPRTPQLRQALLQAFLRAPRGSIDLRPVVRPTVAALLETLRPDLSVASSVEQEGFSLSILPARLDGRLPGAVIETRFPAGAGDASALYVDFTLVLQNLDGTYQFSDAGYPAAPLGGVTRIGLLRIGALTDAGVDVMALRVEDAADPLNPRLEIYGWRGGGAASLVLPGAPLHAAEVLAWPEGGGALRIRQERLESALWGCLAAREVTYTWSLNFFRPQPAAEFVPAADGACALAAEPSVYEQPITEAIARVNSALDTGSPSRFYDPDRLRLTLAMLYALGGQLDTALEVVNGLRAAAQPGSWLAAQTRAFSTTAAQNEVPLRICAALETVAAPPGCDVDAVLTRLFREMPLVQGEPIEQQAARLGLTVLERTTITEVGRVAREAVRFNLSDGDWWAFAPLDRQSYTAERIDPPPGFAPRVPEQVVQGVPQNAYDDLFAGNPRGTLAAVESLIRLNPAIPVSSAARYLTALANDLLGIREAARQGYFSLWSDDPGSVWGQIAAAHLEER